MDAPIFPLAVVREIPHVSGSLGGDSKFTVSPGCPALDDAVAKVSRLTSWTRV